MKHHLSTLEPSRFSQTIKLYLLILIPMWGMFILNNTVFFGLWNVLGIEPREVTLGNVIGILGSWTMHGNLSHIIGNTVVMVQILFLFGIFEKNPFHTITLLIIGAGLFTWILGSDSSIHIGASGLAFAMMGYMIGGALFAKRWGYLVACIFLGAGFWTAMLQGLIPQVGISFAAHFGGLVAGLFYGAGSENQANRIGYKN